MMQGHQCVEKMDVIYQCPVGFSTTSDKSSHHHSSSSSSSHHGDSHHGHHGDNHHHKDGSSCYKLSRSAPLHSCPEGSHPSIDNADFCMRAISFFPEPYCPVGGGKGKSSKTKGGDCVEYKAVAPIGSCRKGFAMQHGTCVSTETYSCSREVVCVGFGCAGGKGKGGGKNESVGKKGHEESHDHHGKKQLRSLMEVAQQSRQLKKKKDKEETKKPVGKKGTHDICERTVYEEPLYKCPAGTVGEQHGHHGGDSHHGHHGGEDKKKKDKKEIMCYKPMSVALLQDCGHGTFDISSGKCIEQSLTQSLETCPHGYEFCDKKGRKLYGKEEEVKGKRDVPSCCSMEFSNPQPVCKHGYIQQGHHCIRATEPTYKCPHGYLQTDGSCSKELRKKPVQFYSVLMCKGKHCEQAHDHDEKKHLRQ
eukprot:GHVS01021792.1.p1 GENE.GHVS01021792.1~~GHVS01021792.1.p1  ORF type:complete len:419 (-),score=81.22 GHVS01021792.1:345-1601(-)